MEGQIISGKYRLARILGKGSMGTVWLAEHLSLHTPVAIKLIDVEAAKNPMARTRFDREAQLAARIRSAHVVKVLDHGTTDTGLPYIAMECLNGESLRERLAARGRLTPLETGVVVSHVCRALARAHEAGLIHRDLKPENIFMAREDEAEIVKILDFGVAKSIDALGAAGMDPTRTGTLLGTPYYMSPEQAQGLKSVDYRSDLWSLGVLVFECLTGKRPFTAAALGPLIAKIIGGAAPTLAAAAPDARLPAELEVWIRKALSRNPAERFASAKQMSEAFMVAAGTVDTMDSGVAGSPSQAFEPSEQLPASENDNAATIALSSMAADPGASGSMGRSDAALPFTSAPLAPVAAALAAAPPAPANRMLVVAVIVLGTALVIVAGILAVFLLHR